MKSFFLIFLCSFSLFAKESFFATFDPPKGWLVSDPSKYEKGIKVGFIASNRQIFTPSMTYAVEKVGEINMETYLNALRKIHCHHRMQELGTFQSNAGKTHLIQIDLKNEWGEIRLLQAISLHMGYALIQTASCLKKDFLKWHETFLSSFKSFTTYPNVFASCVEPLFEEKIKVLARCFQKYRSTSKDDIHTLFASPFFQKNQWEPFVKYLEKRLQSKGACWQLLAIKHIQETLLTESDP